MRAPRSVSSNAVRNLDSGDSAIAQAYRRVVLASGRIGRSTVGVVDAPVLHADVERLAFLLGTWRGQGHGEYPTIESFDYVEEVTFGHVGKPFLAYQQRTRHAETDLPLHAEAGYLRPAGAGADGALRVELVLAHPSGLLELSQGEARATELRLATLSVTGTPTAKAVSAVERDVDVDGDVLRYAVRMAAVGIPMTHHLAAELSRAAR